MHPRLLQFAQGQNRPDVVCVVGVQQHRQRWKICAIYIELVGYESVLSMRALCAQIGGRSTTALEFWLGPAISLARPPLMNSPPREASRQDLLFPQRSIQRLWMSIPRSP